MKKPNKNRQTVRYQQIIRYPYWDVVSNLLSHYKRMFKEAP